MNDTYKGLHDAEGVVRTETVAYQLGGINNQITDEFGTDNDMTVTGGGRGWTAKTTRKGEVFTAKGTSKIGAANALYNQFLAGPLGGAEMGEEAIEEMLDAQPIEGLDFEDMTEGEAAQCVAECVTSERPYCECRCNGRNHGAAHGGTLLAILGAKVCKCGCGETTKRLFVPGHDARFHAEQQLIAYATANGFPVEQLPEAKKHKQAAQRKAARDRRAAKAAKQAKIDARVAREAAKIAASQGDKPKRSRKRAQTTDLSERFPF